MDSFGTWRKWFFFFNAEFYRVVWTINAPLTVCSEMLPFSGKNQNINVWSPPEHFAIGYVHNDNLPLGNIALQYVISNNCRKVWWCFLMISCTFWRSRKYLWNSPKLSCGFNNLHIFTPIGFRGGGLFHGGEWGVGWVGLV